ncbi:hypothetical protein GA0070610_6144 [Micromonospora echinofusca]|uniref:Uncharacterized protein n=1 Tax=Micromonospora echinofusca TaxID=47858 RepID=A0A1C5GIX6_MICEH|nr:hypothetical protein [Micromonospora echinofusca]SCG19740.1 hypothetical protein GA0070610_6129 [Micromonospora echinofusca]SCG19755.1 hypothetical protein GA0070610_6144 [Micromonospora echinofusca]
MKATHNPPTVQVTPADLLRMAALYLRRHGWTQGTYYTPTDTVTPPACAVGAIGMAAAGRPLLHPVLLTRADEDTYRQAIAALVDYLDAFAPVFHIDEDGHLLDEHTAPFSWNDDPTRTAEQVITALEKAADEWDRLHMQGGENR